MLAGAAALLLCVAGAAMADPDDLARAFGSVPELWNARLSPSGEKISFLHMDGAADVPVAFVVTADSDPQAILASSANGFDLRWCDWASETRLLCGYTGIGGLRGQLLPVTRLVAVNDDGTDSRVLLQNQLSDTFTQFQDQIIDWLPDDPETILIELPDTGGSGVARLNIETGRMQRELRERDDTRGFVSDGRGEIRLRRDTNTRRSRWQYRLAGDPEWHLLRESDMSDVQDFWLPVGFGSDRNKLMVLKPHDDRVAFWSEDLTGNEPDALIFAHPEVDVSGVLTLGKYQRVVAVSYSTDLQHLYFFDDEIQAITKTVADAVPEDLVTVIDESWDKRFYLVQASGPRTAGRYYRYDSAERRLLALWPMRPGLMDRELGEMRPIRFAARDGQSIPGYLTMPPAAEPARLPAVIMPHGGPQSRDQFDFDWLAQFMAAKGLAVLQVNFRGSGGYGNDWSGDGGFRAWSLAISDITDGTRYLINEGLVDPSRICIAGWSYGGYAALMSAIEEPDLYRCVVSVAGVTDPKTLIDDARKFLNKTAVREFVGTDSEVLEDGSPYRRAADLKSPVLLFHGDRDINVTVKHSKKMHKALKKQKVDVDLVVYEDATHQIWRNEYRVDMLGKISTFLDENLAATD